MDLSKRFYNIDMIDMETFLLKASILVAFSMIQSYDVVCVRGGTTATIH
jgi:hypothetical protein